MPIYTVWRYDGSEWQKSGIASEENYYETIQEAMAGLRRRATNRSSRVFPRWQIRRGDTVVWEGTKEEAAVPQSPSLGLANINTITIKENEMSNSSSSNTTFEQLKPVHIPRASLLKTLQTRFEEEKAAHDKLQAEKTEARKERRLKVEAVIKDHHDQLIEILVEQYSTPDSLKQRLKAQYVPGAAKYENEPLAKLIRVLELADDKTIEVAPGHDFYRYL